MRRAIKKCLDAVFLLLALPAALVSGFGRIKPVYVFFAQSYAMIPGGIGDFLRVAYYHLTLAECGMSSRISFGSFFAHPEARVGSRVYVGSYCILGKTVIGSGTQLSSAVQILSGQHQHIREDSGAFHQAGDFIPVTIGPDCWIGAAAIVMSDVGARTTIGAGSVVTRPIPADSVAVGSPARVVRSEAPTESDTANQSDARSRQLAAPTNTRAETSATKTQLS
jgi:acetyltransferase-like isoleucine patch superfamily enzyme